VAQGDADARILCNGTGKSSWVAIPEPRVTAQGYLPVDIRTIRYDVGGHEVWRDTVGTPDERDEPKALAFGGTGDVNVAGQRYNPDSKVPPTTIVTKYAE
jgi:hypothetical protein